jgi:hypothetical protein
MSNLSLIEISGHSINMNAISYIQPQGQNSVVIYFIGGGNLMLIADYRQLIATLKEIK